MNGRTCWFGAMLWGTIGCGGDAEEPPTPPTKVAPATLQVTLEGTPRPGGLVLARLRPEGAQSFGTDGLEIQAPTWLHARIERHQADEIQAWLAFDASAPVGLVPLRVVTGELEFEVAEPFSLGEADTPVRLPERWQLGGEPSAIAWVATGEALWLLDVRAPSGVELLWLEEDGSFPGFTSDAHRRMLVPAGQTRGLVAWNRAGAAPSAAVESLMRPLRALVPEQEPNDTPASATALGALEVAAEGSLTSAEDVDVFAIDLDEGYVGRRLRLTTLPGDRAADVRVRMVDQDNVSAFGSGDPDTEYHADYVTMTLPHAGRFFVNVDAGSRFEAGQANYRLAVMLEP